VCQTQNHHYHCIKHRINYQIIKRKKKVKKTIFLQVKTLVGKHGQEGLTISLYIMNFNGKHNNKNGQKKRKKNVRVENF
jgi:hypothetical protein